MSAKLQATTTQTVTTEVKLQPRARLMIVERLHEYATLAAQVLELVGTKKKPGRMRRIKDELEELFRKERAGKALLKGTKIDGFGVKLVSGKRKKFDQLGFMKKHGLTQSDWDEFTTEVDNDPYLKISVPGVEDDD